MAFIFLYPSVTDGFYTNAIGANATGSNSVIGTDLPNTPYFNAVQDGFVAKWQTIVAEICQEAHIYGLRNKDIQDAVGFIKSMVYGGTGASSGYKGQKGWSFLAAADTFATNLKESQQGADFQNTAKIQLFHPDMAIGAIDLTNGRIISRLEFLRTITHLINYECYQDIDGEIIIKPPIYNLDVTNLGSNTMTTAASTSSTTTTTQPPITAANNPFIIHLSEISNESETEDQGAIRATRMVIQGNTTVDTQFIQVGPTIRATAEFMDLPKLAQFGVREEPARTIPWLASNDPTACFAQAAAELALANRGYRTYSFTIPMRPELKLGFPLFIPHRDMYGYVKSVNIQYQIGGDATMSVTLDTLRKRLMFPQLQTMPDGTQGTIFVAQPNLVLKWVQGGSSQQTAVGGITDSSSSPANQIGKPITVPKPPSDPAITADQLALIAFQQQQMGSYFAISGDTKSASWQVQADTEGVWCFQPQANSALQAVLDNPLAVAPAALLQAAQNPMTPSTFFRSVNGDAAFNFYEKIRNTMPYTDQKGYEVVSPFPWGRWVDINTAVQEFTRDGYVYAPTPQTSTFLDVTGINTFLYAGMTTPISASDAASSLTSTLAASPTTAGSTSTTTGNTPITAPGATPTNSAGTINVPADITVFELDYSNFTPAGAGTITQKAQPSNSISAALIVESQAAETQKVNMFLMGASPQPDLTLAAQIQATGPASGVTQFAPSQIPLTPGLFGANPNAGASGFDSSGNPLTQ